MPRYWATIEITRSAYADVEADSTRMKPMRKWTSCSKRVRFAAGKRTYPTLRLKNCRRNMPRGGAVPTNINDESIEVFCKMLKDAIQVNPEARPVVISIIETLMDNHVPQERWGTILFQLWQQLNDKPSEEKEIPGTASTAGRSLHMARYSLPDEVDRLPCLLPPQCAQCATTMLATPPRCSKTAPHPSRLLLTRVILGVSGGPETQLAKISWVIVMCDTAGEVYYTPEPTLGARSTNCFGDWLATVNMTSPAVSRMAQTPDNLDSAHAAPPHPARHLLQMASGTFSRSTTLTPAIRTTCGSLPSSVPASECTIFPGALKVTKLPNLRHKGISTASTPYRLDRVHGGEVIGIKGITRDVDVSYHVYRDTVAAIGRAAP
jgi:hypothetical protein